MDLPYRNFGRYLRERFGAPVIKIPVDAGFSCPNRDGTLGWGGCTFCANESFCPGTLRPRSSVADQVRRARTALLQRNPGARFMVYFQPYTNTHATLDALAQAWDQALEEDVVALAVGTRPDCVPDPVLELLSTYAESREVWLELGLQSAHDETLKRIRRGHVFADFVDATHRASGKGLKTLAHVILGLPGEDEERIRRTARALASLPMDGIKIHHLYVARGTPLEKEYREGGLRTLTPEEYVPQVVDFLERTPGRVVVQRLVSDPEPSLLVAPKWKRTKVEILDAIVREFERRGTKQGSRCE